MASVWVNAEQYQHLFCSSSQLTLIPGSNLNNCWLLLILTA